MALSPKLAPRQSQTLAMTPQLLQAIRLLQLPALELEAYVAAEMERNPLLAPAAPEPSPDTPEPPDRTSREDAAPLVDAEPPDVDPADLFPDEVPPLGSASGAPLLGSWSGATPSGLPHDIENTAASIGSLSDHLLAQLGLEIADPTRRTIGAALIGLVDEAGYLRDDPADIAERLGVEISEVTATLDRLKTFDPPGVFARDLAECLALQLIERNRHDPAMQALLARLDLVARRDLTALQEACGVDVEDLVDMLAELKTLDPKPGAAFGDLPARTAIADVIVRPAAGHGWSVELNPDALPRVLVDRSYYVRVARRSRDPNDKAFLATCLQEANWLVKCLDQRARTILRVAAEIVRRQEGFLAEGVRSLRPLNLKAVAEATGLHESTISRATANKTLSTPRGIFDMKYFFTAAIQATDGGEAYSAEAVRACIRRLVENESPDAILSDGMIVHRLAEEGIEIALRTVAKYRNAMRIPPLAQRRREKAAGAGRVAIDSVRHPS